MGHFHHHYHRSSRGTRAFYNMLFLLLSIAAISMLVMGILCLAGSGSVGYCTHMSMGGFIGLLTSGLVLVAFCILFLFCVGCFVDSAERATLL